MVNRFTYSTKNKKITDNHTKREYSWNSLDEITELVILLNRLSQQ